VYSVEEDEADVDRPDRVEGHLPGGNVFIEWDRAADDTVASTRIEASRTPHDRGLSDLVGELSTRSDEFRVACAFMQAGVKRLRHPMSASST
jgi:hypothetical protein